MTSPLDPLVPDDSVLAPLLEGAKTLLAEKHRLESRSGALGPALRPLLRCMNSYHASKIDEQDITPAQIFSAARGEFSQDRLVRHRQRLAFLHMQTEREQQDRLPLPHQELYTPAFIRDLHVRLHAKLAAGTHSSKDGSAIPGALREVSVEEGMYRPPQPAEVPDLLTSWQRGYTQLDGPELSIVGAACSHPRLLWLRPFGGGNWRVARLHTQLLFENLGLLQGLWSPLRGLGRDREEYRSRLNRASAPRRDEEDGAGPLSQDALVDFARWFLDLSIEQTRFTRGLLDAETFAARLRALLSWLEAHPWTIGSEKSVVKVEAFEALHYVALTGPIERARFMAMTGLLERTARRVLKSLLDFGILASESSRASVRFQFPPSSLPLLLPGFWPEAEVRTEQPTSTRPLSLEAIVE